jgi:hypothetical protein
MFHLENASAPLPATSARDIIPPMRSRSTDSTTPDLFSVAACEPSPPAASQPKPPTPSRSAAQANSRRSVLPSDLPAAIKHLDDQELDRLGASLIAELKRRGKKLPGQEEASPRRQVEDTAVSLTPGKLNAVRAALKAGVTPSKIARQFGMSQSEVRKALAGSSSKSAKA